MKLLYWLILKNLRVTLFRGNFDHETRLQEPACSPELSNRSSFRILSLVGAQPGVVQMVLLATSKIKTCEKKNMEPRVQKRRPLDTGKRRIHRNSNLFSLFRLFSLQWFCAFTAEHEYKTDYYSVLQVMYISSLLGDNFLRGFSHYCSFFLTGLQLCLTKYILCNGWEHYVPYRCL
jgi:hypothetical protein